MIVEITPENGAIGAGAATVIALLTWAGFKRGDVRRFLIAFWKQRRYKRGQLQRIEDGITETRQALDEHNERLKSVEYQVNFNGGGSMRDAIESLVADKELRFQGINYPAYECDKEGNNIRVSDAYLTLARVRRKEDLESQDWKRFCDVKDATIYFKGFKDAALTGSDHTGVINVYDGQRNTRGQWLVLNRHKVDGTYFGRLIPMDDEALSICERNNWQVPPKIDNDRD